MNIILRNLDPEKVISRILNNKVVKKLINTVSSKPALTRAVALCIIGVCAIIISIAATGITLGFNVEYSGRVIATVKNADVATAARLLAIESVAGDDVGEAIAPTRLSLTLTVTDKLESAKTLAENMLKNTKDIVSASALMVNGQKVACAEEELLNQLVEAKRTAYYIEGAQNSASFVENVEIVSGKYLSCKMDSLDNAKNIINNLQVKTISTITTDEKIAYSTKTIYSDDYSKGYVAVTTAGVNGVTRKTETIESINGNQSSRVMVSSQVISEPVTKVTVVGTAPIMVEATQKATVSSAGFICPIEAGKFTVSSYWGDGRGHRALDLAAKKGVAIFAAASGTVTECSYRSDYGYYVVITHSNGMKTRYAHCNALAVKSGQAVSQGDMIATVGSTGRSTGNHLHFEIEVNGNRVNPAPYIGLN